MRRSNPASGGSTTSDSVASAIDIMYRARMAVVFTSPSACDTGLPIIREMSSAMLWAFFSICWTACSQSVMRSCSLLERHARARLAGSIERPSDGRLVGQRDLCRRAGR